MRAPAAPAFHFATKRLSLLTCTPLSNPRSGLFRASLGFDPSAMKREVALLHIAKLAAAPDTPLRRGVRQRRLGAVCACGGAAVLKEGTGDNVWPRLGGRVGGGLNDRLDGGVGSDQGGGLGDGLGGGLSPGWAAG